MQLRFFWLQHISIDSTALLPQIGTLENPVDLLTHFVQVNVLEKLTGKIGLIDLHVRLHAVYVDALRTSHEHASKFASCNTGEETATNFVVKTNCTCCLFVPILFDYVSFRRLLDISPNSLSLSLSLFQPWRMELA